MSEFEKEQQRIVSNMIEVKLCGRSFYDVCECLTRMGISSERSKTLFQSCHILHKRGKYYICHFKELFELNGRGSDISNEDIGRRNRIAKLLDSWGYCKIVSTVGDLECSNFTVIKKNEKHEWSLVPKYKIKTKANS